MRYVETRAGVFAGFLALDRDAVRGTVHDRVLPGEHTANQLEQLGKFLLRRQRWTLLRRHVRGIPLRQRCHICLWPGKPGLGRPVPLRARGPCRGALAVRYRQIRALLRGLGRPKVASAGMPTFSWILLAEDNVPWHAYLSVWTSVLAQLNCIDTVVVAVELPRHMGARVTAQRSRRARAK
jgi:hypothetical protein